MSGFIIGPILCVLGLFAWIPVSLFAIFGHYPKWLRTPDDPRSPFGQYEPLVKSIYEKYGRYIGDLYWLGFRNTLYGISYCLKPKAFKEAKSYFEFFRTQKSGKFYKLSAVEKASGRGRWFELVLYVGPFSIIWGNRLHAVMTNNDEVRHPNMDGRPIFSIRLNKNA